MFFLKVFTQVYAKIFPSRMDMEAHVEASAGCAPMAQPASRLDMELRDIDKWQEAIRLREAALKLCRSVPRPLNPNTPCVLEDVQNFLEDFSELRQNFLNSLKSNVRNAIPHIRFQGI